MRSPCVPDPHQQPYQHLSTRNQQLHQAQLLAAEAHLFAAAHELRSLWPTVGALVFSQRELRRRTWPTRSLLWLERADGQVIASQRDIAQRIQHDPATRELLANILSGVMVGLRHANASAHQRAGQSWGIRTRQACGHTDDDALTVVVLPEPAAAPTTMRQRAREVAELRHAEAEGAPYSAVRYGSCRRRWASRTRFARRYVRALLGELLG